MKRSKGFWTEYILLRALPVLPAAYIVFGTALNQLNGTLSPTGLSRPWILLIYAFVSGVVEPLLLIFMAAMALLLPLDRCRKLCRGFRPAAGGLLLAEAVYSLLAGVVSLTSLSGGSQAPSPHIPAILALGFIILSQAALAVSFFTGFRRGYCSKGLCILAMAAFAAGQILDFFFSAGSGAGLYNPRYIFNALLLTLPRLCLIYGSQYPLSSRT